MAYKVPRIILRSAIFIVQFRTLDFTSAIETLCTEDPYYVIYTPLLIS